MTGGFSTHAKGPSVEADASRVSGEFKKMDKDFNADAIPQLNGPMSPALSDFIKKNISLKESFANLDAYAITGRAASRSNRRSPRPG